MFDSSLRQVKDQLATPIAMRLGKVSPVTVTWIAFVVGLGSALLVARGNYLWAVLFWSANRALDGLDGLLARLHDQQSDFGGYLDTVLDHVIYATVPIGLVMSAPSDERYLALAFMLTSYYVNGASWMYLAGIIEKRRVHDDDTQTTILMPPGLIGGAETILAYYIFLFFPSRMAILFVIFGSLVFLTIIQRLIWARRNLL
jgi:phosphatidylglycerophosphate synthase